jgi:folate-dependent phosphoribosylglycinamide formyltransferase PurN
MILRLAIFASGRGSNFQAMLEAVATQRLKAQVVLCVSIDLMPALSKLRGTQEFPWR